MPLKHGIHHRAFVKFKVILAQNRHAFSRALLHCSMRRRKLPRQNTHQRAFACAIRANDPITVACRKLQIDILEKHPLAKLHP